MNPKIAIYETSSEGCQIIYNQLKNIYSITIIHKVDVENGLVGYDLAIFPGSYEHIFAYISSKKFQNRLINYVKNGGNFLGICGGSVLGLYLYTKTIWSLDDLRLAPYYIYYVIFNKRGKFHIKWEPNNNFGKIGEQEITWAGGPYITENLGMEAEAKYTENKFLLPFKNKIAIASGKFGNGKVVLFGPHPEYPCNDEDNFDLIIKTINNFFKA